MDDSRAIDDMLSDDHHNFLGSTHNDEFGSHNFLANLMKNSLLLGADKLLMARKPGPASSFSDFEPQNDNKIRNVPYNAYATQPAFSSPSNNSNNNDFPLNVIAFLSLQVLNLIAFQLSLFLRLFTFPFRVFTFFIMFIMFPFQILTHLRDHMKKKLMRACNVFYSRLIDRLKSPKSVLNLALKFSRAVFCAANVFFVLVCLLVLGFAIGGIVMRNLVQESIHTTEALTFDYTTTSPAANVPIASSLVDGTTSKLKLTVSLTLPESEYNRKLGIFQVRVETLSENGKVIVGSSYPTMLRFKSNPVRAVETLLNSVHLITGLKSEVQKLKIVMGEFNKGYKPASSFKVILVQRAEFEGGSGVPEIYGGTLEIASELPKLKRILWSWRRTMFVWIGFGFFVAEMMVLLIFFRGIVLSKSKGTMSSYNKKCWSDKILWHKAI
ncbi:hypothetical protein CASFOL_024464 [Castilleja foliolosa]|uniref:Seipin n=1 Tax=Castilleja foliolosa TaxID=1961234 RepID=A0ABD3CRY5_9LAMI